MTPSDYLFDYLLATQPQWTSKHIIMSMWLGTVFFYHVAQLSNLAYNPKVFWPCPIQELFRSDPVDQRFKLTRRSPKWFQVANIPHALHHFIGMLRYTVCCLNVYTHPFVRIHKWSRKKLEESKVSLCLSYVYHHSYISCSLQMLGSLQLGHFPSLLFLLTQENMASFEMKMDHFPLTLPNRLTDYPTQWEGREFQAFLLHKNMLFF